jgi:DNA-binding IclR family transcriptional regulator
MKRPELPADLRRFILTSIPSVPYLEAVLLLRAEPQRDWDTAAVARRLYLPEAQVRPILEGLQGAGIAQPGPAGVRYGPSTDELAQMLDRLAAHYAADLVGISDLIHSRVDKKAQQFADAFRWRKDS